MNRFEKLPFIIFISSLAATVLSAVVRLILTLTLLDANYGVYAHGNILPTVYHIILAFICAALAAVAFIKAPVRDKSYFPKTTNAVLFSSCVISFLLAFKLLFSLYYIVTGKARADAFDILEICFAIPSIVYFFGLTRQNARSTVMAATSLFPIAWCAVCLIRIYFDNTMLMTSPNKIMSELALLFAMIFFLTEARAQLGLVSSKLFLAAGSVSPILLLTSSVPNLLFSNKLFIGKSDNYMMHAVCAAMGLLMLARLAEYAKKQDIPDEKEAAAKQ